MRRRIGFLFLSLGLLTLAWVGITLWRGDPITSLYTRYEQHRLAARLATVDEKWGQSVPASVRAERVRASSAVRLALTASNTKRVATAFNRSLHDGDPIGKIAIPRLHLKIIVVQGTSEHDLTTGPGHYDKASGRSTTLPGMGGVIAIAGHRTTYLHPFRHIDDLKAGDNIYLLMPYGTFRYTVVFHEVVRSTDWSILKPRRRETLVLSACHPLYSASHRWVVFARLTHSPAQSSS